MRVLVIGVLTVAIGFAVGWSAALTVERGTQPATADEMYARMSLALSNYEDPVERSSMVTKLVKHLSEENLDGAIRAFRDRASMPYLSAFDIRVFLARWAQLKGEAPFEETRTWGVDQMQSLALVAVMHELARRGDIDRARELMSSVPDGMRESASGALFVAGAAFGHVDMLESLVLTFPEGGGERKTAMRLLVGQLRIAEGDDRLEQWVEGLEHPGPEGYKFLAYESAVRAIAIGSIDEARTWVESLRVSGEGWARRGPEFLVETWSHRDPQAAVEWAMALPVDQDEKADQVRARAVRKGLERWINADPDAAGAWLLEQEPRPGFDKYNEKVALHFAFRDPQKSIDFAERIVSPKARNRLKGLLLSYWKRREDYPQLQSRLEATRPPQVTDAPGS